MSKSMSREERKSIILAARKAADEHRDDDAARLFALVKMSFVRAPVCN